MLKKCATTETCGPQMPSIHVLSKVILNYSILHIENELSLERANATEGCIETTNTRGCGCLEFVLYIFFLIRFLGYISGRIARTQYMQELHNMIRYRLLRHAAATANTTLIARIRLFFVYWLLLPSCLLTVYH